MPKNIWFNSPGPVAARGVAETQTAMAHPSAVVNGSSLPYDPFTPYLEQASDIRVQGTTALPTTNLSSIKQGGRYLRADDPFRAGARGELHLLPQHALIRRLVDKLAGESDGVVRHQDGA